MGVPAVKSFSSVIPDDPQMGFSSSACSNNTEKVKTAIETFFKSKKNIIIVNECSKGPCYGFLNTSTLEEKREVLLGEIKLFEEILPHLEVSHLNDDLFFKLIDILYKFRKNIGVLRPHRLNYERFSNLNETDLFKRSKDLIKSCEALIKKAGNQKLLELRQRESKSEDNQVFLKILDVAENLETEIQKIGPRFYPTSCGGTALAIISKITGSVSFKDHLRASFDTSYLRKQLQKGSESLYFCTTENKEFLDGPEKERRIILLGHAFVIHEKYDEITGKPLYRLYNSYIDLFDLRSYLCYSQQKEWMTRQELDAFLKDLDGILDAKSRWTQKAIDAFFRYFRANVQVLEGKRETRSSEFSSKPPFSVAVIRKKGDRFEFCKPERSLITVNKVVWGLICVLTAYIIHNYYKNWHTHY